MKKLLIWIISILLIVVAIDLGGGFLFKKYLANHSLRGDYVGVDHLLKDSTEEIIVLGSSVGLNSINTRMLSDSLKITAYNGASNGQSFPYYLTLMEVLAERPNLKMVILGMKENALTDTGLGSRYNFLIPYYNTGFEGIDNRMEQRPFDKYLLKSSLYRYNTIWFRILLYSIFEPGIKGQNGFIAKDIPPYPPVLLSITESNDSVTSERKAEFEKFVALCKSKDIHLIVCIPPRYEKWEIENEAEKYLNERADKNDFELWFDAFNTPLSQESELFYDNDHLNYKGAEKYTETIIQRLK